MRPKGIEHGGPRGRDHRDTRRHLRPDAEQTRAFFRDVLDFSNVDGRDGWLIFKLPPAELGIHPTSGKGVLSGRHEIYLMCDDINATIAHVRAKGVEFLTPVEDRGFGLVMV